MNEKKADAPTATGPTPTPPYHDPGPASITWDDLRRVERAFMPLLILSGGEDERDPLPPQALVRLNLRMIWRELRSLADRIGGGQ